MRITHAVIATLVAVLVAWWFHRRSLAIETLDTPTVSPDVLITYRGPAFMASDLPKLGIAKAFVKTQTEHTCKEPIRKCKFGLLKIAGADENGVPIEFVLSDHLAGAVYRIVYGGLDFIQPMPIVGGSMQTALSFDIRKGGRNEQYNPTEAGCEKLDSFREKSSSVMRALRGNASAVFTQVRPAYFKAPGSMLENKDPAGPPIPVLNTTLLSEVIHSKRIEFVAPGVVDYHVKLHIPDKHYFSQVEFVAGWVPAAASAQTLMYQNDAWTAAKGPANVNSKGVQRTGGMALATADGSKAMGVALLDWPRGAIASPPYYNFFPSERTMKFNVGQKFGSGENYTHKIPGGPLVWKVRFFFGTLEDVQAAIVDVQASIPIHGKEYQTLQWGESDRDAGATT